MVEENILETSNVLYKWPRVIWCLFKSRYQKDIQIGTRQMLQYFFSWFEAISNEDEKLFGKHFGSHVGGDYLINIWHGYDWSLTGTSQQRCTINISGTSTVLNTYSKYCWFK